MTDAAHDLFTMARPALGHLAGNIYARTDHTPATLDDLARTIGAGPVRTARLLDRLAYAGIVEPTPAGWVRSSRSTVDAAAERFAIAGRLDARATRYRIEREVWAWGLCAWRKSVSSVIVSSWWRLGCGGV